MAIPSEVAAKKFTEVQKKILAYEEEGLNINRISNRLAMPVAVIRDEKKKISKIWDEADKECGLEP